MQCNILKLNAYFGKIIYYFPIFKFYDKLLLMQINSLPKNFSYSTSEHEVKQMVVKQSPQSAYYQRLQLPEIHPCTGY